MVTEVPYHMMKLLSNKKVGIAFRQRYIADTYYVVVLKWNGDRLVLHEELYSNYYLQLKSFITKKYHKYFLGSDRHQSFL